MRRREFITLLGGAAAAWPLVARGQQRPAMPVVAFFSAGPRAGWVHIVAAFREGLRETGFVEGQNVVIEYVFAEDQYDRLPALAADLVKRRVAVIVAYPRAVNAAKAATSTIPIVFSSGSDPVRLGLVASLNRPGGNLTGVSFFAGDLTAKRFGLLHQAVPQAAVIGILKGVAPSGTDIGAEEVDAVVRSVGMPTRSITAGSEGEIEAAFATFAHEGVGALFVVNNFLFFSLRDRLAELAARYRIPASTSAQRF
jgi:putative ABC transport system substrate-binding protein